MWCKVAIMRANFTIQAWCSCIVFTRLISAIRGCGGLCRKADGRCLLEHCCVSRHLANTSNLLLITRTALGFRFLACFSMLFRELFCAMCKTGRAAYLVAFGGVHWLLGFAHLGISASLLPQVSSLFRFASCSGSLYLP